MAKLTLSVDESVILKARRYAKEQGVSVSKMVETYLAAVAGPANQIRRATPVLRSLRGSLRNAEVDDYRNHLAAKYR